MDNNKEAGSTDSKFLPNLDHQILHTDMQWIHATLSHPKHTTATDDTSVETMAESKIANTVTSYEQVKNLMTKVLDSNSLLLVNENSDKEKKTSCLDPEKCFDIVDVDEGKKEDSEEDIEDEIDEEDEDDDEDDDEDEDEEEEDDEDDSCESDDDISDSLKSCSNLYLFSPNFLNHALNDDSVKNVERPDANEETGTDKVDKTFVNRPNSYYIEKKKERRNKQNMLRIDCKPKKERSSNWLTEQMYSGANPRKLLTRILPYSRPDLISPRCSDSFIWKIIANACSEPPRRSRLSSVSTFNDVIDLLEKSTNIIVLTGAGVSVSCGIPDFRSNDGIYSRLAKDFPDLPDPQAMFDINYFSRDPRPFYKFAREIYPGQFKPSPCHRFIKLLEDKNKLLRNYTQNIDTLEQVAGIKNVIECHGSFSTATCTKCKYKCDADSIRSDIFEQRIPVCPRCQPDVEHSVYASQPVSEEALCNLVANGIMKPDIVFFGEGLSDEFHTVMASDKNECDLLIVMGSSLKVRPVALIPSSIPAHVPQILINREKLLHLDFDVKLLGDGDVIINQICQRLGGDFKDVCFNDVVLRESTDLMPMINAAEEEIEPKEEQTDCIRCKQLVKLHYSQPPLAFRRRYLLLDPSKGGEEEVKKSPEELKCPKCTYWAACASYRLQQQRRQNKKISERLLNGTYYCHQQSASYVFPGAQVSACSDTETDDEELFAEISPLNIEAAEEEEAAASSHQSHQQPLSPIMSSSIEAEMVSDITNMKHQTSIPATGNDVNASLQKRSSPELTDAECAANRETHTNSTNVDSCIIATKQQDGLSHPPPYKRPRDSLEKVNAAIDLEQNTPGAVSGWHNATNNAL